MCRGNSRPKFFQGLDSVGDSRHYLAMNRTQRRSQEFVVQGIGRGRLVMFKTRRVLNTETTGGTALWVIGQSFRTLVYFLIERLAKTIDGLHGHRIECYAARWGLDSYSAEKQGAAP